MKSTNPFRSFSAVLAREMAQVESIQAIADRLEITVEGESSGDEKESLKEECEKEQHSSSLLASVSNKGKESGGSSGGSSEEDGDMHEDPAKEDKEDDFKEEDEEMKTVDFIKDARIKKQEALQAQQKRRLTKHEQSSKAKGKLSSDKIGYTKPDYGLDREKERKLLHAATKGVVQLFNAVADRQKFLDQKLEELSTGNRIQRQASTAPKRMKMSKEEEMKEETEADSSTDDGEEDDEDKDDIDLCGSSEGDLESDDEELKEEVESIDESY
uniref:RRP15-like protein n=1 Tax=Ditylenchus dipsaci TaxID=166011 RepID=A0A915E9A8_9BILA